MSDKEPTPEVPVPGEVIPFRSEGRKQPTPSGFRFNIIGRLLANMEPPAWLIHGICEADSMAMLWGEPGHGKSFIAMDMAACIATGTDWHGNKTQQGAVLYIAGEGHRGIAHRLAAWSIHQGVKLDQAPLAVSSAPAMLDDATNLTHVLQAIEAAGQCLDQAPAFIVVDTLARNFSGDENSARDISAFINNVDYLRRQWAATVLIVHHSGKDVTRGARGSVALRAAVDAEYSARMDSEKRITLEAHKMKDAETPKSMEFELQAIPLELRDGDGNQIFSCAPNLVRTGPTSRPLGPQQQRALEALRQLYQEHRQRLEVAGKSPDTARVLVSDWRDRCAFSHRNVFYKVKTALRKMGLIRISDQYAELTE